MLNTKNPVHEKIKKIFLSYPLEAELPIYGKVGHLDIKAEKSMTRGDSCQTFQIGFNNHWGTHVDCPAHFFMKGMKVSDYPADFWHFLHPQVIKIKLNPGQLVQPSDLKEIRSETDLLLIQSGWSKKRNESEYSTQNPGVAAETGNWLRENYPSLKMIGFDWISISSYQNREEGRKAHQTFLNPDSPGHSILICEDMDLSDDLSSLTEVWVSPLRVKEIDSAPCTVFGVTL